MPRKSSARKMLAVWGIWTEYHDSQPIQYRTLVWDSGKGRINTTGSVRASIEELRRAMNV